LFCIISDAQEINYTVFKKDSDCNGANNGLAEINVQAPLNPPYTYLWNFSNTNHIVGGLGPGNYYVTITDADDNDTVIHITIDEIPCVIEGALVFTPNGDGYNDTWSINNIENYPNNLILVYNRWGQKVFESKGAYEPWDGRDLLGGPVPDNSYFYIIYGDSKDEGTIIKGSVSILR
jgi:gliding motility-associated-like protein